MHVRRTRLIAAIAAATSLVAGLLVLLVAPAGANHGALVLEVYREFRSVAVGGTAVVTARLTTTNGGPPTSTQAGVVRIRAEAEGGTADGEGGANTPLVPDYLGCTTPAGTGAGVYPECNIPISNPTGLAGTSLVRFWIDHDGLTTSVEADDLEGRLSTEGEQGTDCRTEAPAPAGTGSTDPRGDLEACTTNDTPAVAGRTAEPDDTDVIKVTFFRPDAEVRFDCPESTTAPRTIPAVVRCKFLDQDGSPRSGLPVDAVHQSGANDVNGAGPSDGEAADYDDTDVVSGGDGSVPVTITANTTNLSDVGTATICAWYDTDDADDNDIDPDFPLNDPSYDSGGIPGDGGHCKPDSEESAPPGDSPSTNTTDRFNVVWVDRVATTLDVAPETATSAIGTNHTLTGTVTDQFNEQWQGAAVEVRFEFLAGSPFDSDGSTPASPDRLCNTIGGPAAGSNVCTLQYTANSVGTDVICAWINAAPTAACDGETGATDSAQARVDVISKVWTSSSSSPTTTGPGGTATTTPAPSSGDQGYYQVGADGAVFAFGTGKFHGSLGDRRINEPIIGIAAVPGGTGYWLVAKDGGIFSFDTDFHGSLPSRGIKPNAPILGIEPTKTGKGYWVFAQDGGIFSFGDASFKGSTGGMKLNQPVVGMEVTSKGDGYWLVAQDGGLFAFNAPFHGSIPELNTALNQPVFDLSAGASDEGYWFVAKDGGVFSFPRGRQPFYGSAAGRTSATVIGMATEPKGKGYWIADSVGAVFAFGDAKALGDRRGQASNAAFVAFAGVKSKSA